MQKICVIGCGPIGNTHASVYASHPNAKLLAVCDIREDRARAAGERLGVPWYLDAQAMLTAQRPNIVSVCTSGFEYSSDHYEATLLALRNGCHVLCEKPICNDLQKGRHMVDTARELGLCLGVDLNHRFTPAARQAKAWQNEGRLGDPLFLNMSLWIGRFDDERFDTEYYHMKALNPHSCDIIRHFGGDVEEVFCYGMKAPGRMIYSSISVNMRFASGAVGHLTSSYDIARAHPMERCEVAGTKGRIVVEDMWREATLYPAETMLKQVYTNPVFGGYGQFYDTFRDRITHFVDEVDVGTAPDKIDGTGADGLEASRIIHAAIESLKTHAPVRVQEVLR